jgi:CTP:molybdopterin cytidylyltransferase MocA
MKTAVVLAAASHEMDFMYVNQMIPVRGKPAIAWVLEGIANCDQAICVLDVHNAQTVNYVKRMYPKIKIALVDSKKENAKPGGFTILDSLYRGLSDIDEKTDDLIVVLGDTLCVDLKTCTDCVVVSNNGEVSERWCLVDTVDGFVNNFYDKKTGVDLQNKSILVGIYDFGDVELLKHFVNISRSNNKNQLSDVLSEYAKIHKLKAVKTDVWFDFGHKAGLIKAQHYLYNSRDFNSLVSDGITGVITKTSVKVQKIKDEYDWCNGLPNDIRVLVPRMLDFSVDKDGKASVSMEMYGYPALSELFILGNLSFEEWVLIIRRLFDVHKLLEKHKGKIDRQNFLDLYVNKTWTRLAELKTQSDFWLDLYDADVIEINGCKYKNIKYFESELNRRLSDLIDSVDVSIMHGDYCFSNILFDTDSFICRLIDPRGRLNQQTIYGDPRYDIAKLRHSFVGGYDYIVHGLYSLQQNGHSFTVKIERPLSPEKSAVVFDNLATEYGFNPSEIKLIEAVLFLSMIPLHKDDINRQKVFYLKAVKQLNEVMENSK